MAKNYALIAEENITPEKAVMFQVVTNHSFNYALESHQVTDASGQESTVLTKWITFRWVESGQEGFTQEQLTCIEGCKNLFNQTHPALTIDFQIVGDVEWARTVNTSI